jgi:hypothetical protein
MKKLLDAKATAIENHEMFLEDCDGCPVKAYNQALEIVLITAVATKTEPLLTQEIADKYRELATKGHFSEDSVTAMEGWLRDRGR